VPAASSSVAAGAATSSSTCFAPGALGTPPHASRNGEWAGELRWGVTIVHPPPATIAGACSQRPWAG
jgi:hypothetical protein